jgi:hypothetical protein
MGPSVGGLFFQRLEDLDETLAAWVHEPTAHAGEILPRHGPDGQSQGQCDQNEKKAEPEAAQPDKGGEPCEERRRACARAGGTGTGGIW